MSSFNSPRHNEDRSQCTELDTPQDISHPKDLDEASEERSSRYYRHDDYPPHFHHHHHSQNHHHAGDEDIRPPTDWSRSAYYPGWPNYATSRSHYPYYHHQQQQQQTRYPFESPSSRQPSGYYDPRRGDQNPYTEPPSPSHFSRPVPPSCASYARPDPYHWEGDNTYTPIRNNQGPRDYSYHPTDGNVASPPAVSRENSFEFVGRRFVPTDEPLPALVPRTMHPYSPPIRPPPPPPPPPRQQLQPQSVASPPPSNTATASSCSAPETALQDYPASWGKYIWETRPYDVLCGRGVPTAHQWGNHLFKTLVKERQIEYLACERNDKPKLSMEIIDIISSYHGRFLRRVKVPHRQERFAWVELTDQRSYEKVCQALRDGGPRIRQAMMALTSSTTASKEKEKDSNEDKENSENRHTSDNR
eukprot:scaffold1184_cov132-Cylindrotheca_fusiformis.AAC.1